MSDRVRIRQRLLIEDLRRKRRSDDADRFSETFRRSTIEPNPHQIEAAMFALGRLPGGGALLCDEVGLGKTIEAGLVVSQLRAQGRTHVLIVVPLSLAGQWQVELRDLFSLRSIILAVDAMRSSLGRGIYIVGRDLAGTAGMRSWLQGQGPWDLIVIDEAHEMFATIHTRFSKHTGSYQESLSKGGARRAAQVRVLLQGVPVLLLTATPMQNSLLELWGLVQYVDPEHQVLGKVHEFCSLFVAGEGGRSVAPGMEESLRQRLSLVLKRTLRRQAQPFMKQPFRNRLVHTADFNPDALESELYAAVSRWLSQDAMAAYRQGHRPLMALQLRRRMASSTEALLSTLEGIKDRILQMQRTGVYPGEDRELEIEDLEDERPVPAPVDVALLERDLQAVDRLAGLARQVLASSPEVKKRKLLEVIRQVAARTIEGVASDKVVVFTESRKTLDSLQAYLEQNGLDGQVTTFAGTNDNPRALQRWEEEVGQFLGSAHPEPTSALRNALIHEFRTRTRVLIATEAGAKGLNLQFCNCLVNYDLPWNPQRIEQRIGRVHRYGQQHDVVIVNFINLSNAAESRVYELLEQKLHVFREVLDASDVVLSAPDVALNLEMRLNELLNQCRTPEEIDEAFDRLNLQMDEMARRARDAHLAATRRSIDELDESVRARLGALDREIGPAVSRQDQALIEILEGSSPVEVLGADGPRTILTWRGKRYHLGPPRPGETCGEPLNLDHAEVQDLMQHCIEETEGKTLACEGESWDVYRIALQGLEEEEQVVAIGTGSLYPGGEDLETVLTRLRHEAEQRERRQVDRLLAQIAARREDLRRFGTLETADLQKKLDARDRARRAATSAAAMAQAQAQYKRLLSDMDKLRRQTEEEAQQTLQRLELEERRLRQLRYVEAVPHWLFRVRPSVEGEKEERS